MFFVNSIDISSLRAVETMGFTVVARAPMGLCISASMSAVGEHEIQTTQTTAVLRHGWIQSLALV